MKHFLRAVTPLLGGFLIIAGCSGERNESTSNQPSPAGMEQTVQVLPASFFLDAPPEGAVGIGGVRRTSQTGDNVVLTGYIGGRREPMTAGRAIFQMVDAEEVPVCTDCCETWWDACCEPAEVISANSATIQIADDEGRPLRIDLADTGRITPGKTITVDGTVRLNDDGVSIVDARSVYIGVE